MSATFDTLGRRGFFRISALAGGCFFLGSFSSTAADSAPESFSPNA